MSRTLAHECKSLFIQYFRSILNNSRIAPIADRLKQLFIRTDFIVNMDISFFIFILWPKLPQMAIKKKKKKPKIKQIETKNAVIWNDTMNLKIITVYVHYFDWMKLKLNCCTKLTPPFNASHSNTERIKMIRAHDAPYFMNYSLWKVCIPICVCNRFNELFLWQFKCTKREHFRHVFEITQSWLWWWAENWTW